MSPIIVGLRPYSKQIENFVSMTDSTFALSIRELYTTLLKKSTSYTQLVDFL